MTKIFRAIENGIQQLYTDKGSQTDCLRCNIGPDYLQKVQEVFSREGLDPAFAVVALATLMADTPRMVFCVGEKGKMITSDCCVGTTPFLDKLAELLP